jgi:hypothetical protein
MAQPFLPSTSLSLNPFIFPRTPEMPSRSFTSHIAPSSMIIQNPRLNFTPSPSPAPATHSQASPSDSTQPSMLPVEAPAGVDTSVAYLHRCRGAAVLGNSACRMLGSSRGCFAAEGQIERLGTTCGVSIIGKRCGYREQGEKSDNILGDIATASGLCVSALWRGSSRL